MTHYSVAVFLRDGTSPKKAVKRLLAPYEENLPVEKRFYKTKAEVIREEREQLQKDYKEEYCVWKENPKAYEAKGLGSGYIKYVKSIPKRLKWSDEEIFEDYLGDDKEDMLAKGLLNEAGDLFQMVNPNAQWDDYCIGGRWHGELILKRGKTGIRGIPGLLTEPSDNYDGAYVRDINFERMRRRDRMQLSTYEEAKKESLDFGEDFLAYCRDEEDYIQRNTTFGTYAVITPDGKWHAPGSIGWFGFSTDTAETKRAWDLEYHERFLKPALENNWYMVIVDCHI